MGKGEEGYCLRLEVPPQVYQLEGRISISSFFSLMLKQKRQTVDIKYVFHCEMHKTHQFCL